MVIYRYIDETVCFVSGFTLFVVGIYMFANSKFNRHPYTLIYLACLTESMFYISVTTWCYPCRYPWIVEMFARTTSFSSHVSMKNVNEKLVLVHQSINFQYELGSDLSIFLNCAIFVDLYLNIKNPFSPKEKRMKWYYIGSSLIVLQTVVLYALFTKPSQNGIKSGSYNPYHY